MPGTIGMNIELNTQNLESGLNNAVNQVRNANTMIASSSTPSMTGNSSLPPMSGVEGSTVLNGGENQQTDIMNRQLEAHKLSNDFLKKIYDLMVAKNGGTGGGSAGNGSGVPSSVNRSASVGNFGGARNVINGAGNVALAAERGDVAGIGFGIGNMAIQGLEGGSKYAAAQGMAGLAKGLMGGAVVGLAAMAIGKGMEEMSKQYENNLSGTEEAMRAFGGSSISYGKDGYKNNANLAQNMLNLVSNKGFIQGTGLSNAEFASTWANMGKYGYKGGLSGELSTFDAARATQLSAYMSHVTGADIGTVQNLMGTAYRYNGENADSVAKSVYGAASVQGLNDRQAPELVNAITRAMEDGVSKGFVKSSKEIASDLSFLASATDNATWKGEAGAQKYNQIASGIANSTALSNSSQVLAYRGMSNYLAGKDVKAMLDKNGSDTYIEGEDTLNTFAMMERGADAGAMQSIHNQLKGAYGNDKWGIIESYRQMNGMNYNGAMQLYNLMEKNPNMDQSSMQKEIDKIKADKNNQSDSTKMQDSVNDINLAISNLGKNIYEVKMEGMGEIGKHVATISGWLTKDAYSSMISGTTERFFDSTKDAYKDKADKKDFDKNVKALFENPTTVAQGQAIMDALSSLSDEEIGYMNEHDILNSIDVNSPDAVKHILANRGKKSSYNDIMKLGFNHSISGITDISEIADNYSLANMTNEQKAKLENMAKFTSSYEIGRHGDAGVNNTFEQILQQIKDIGVEMKKPRELEYAK